MKRLEIYLPALAMLILVLASAIDAASRYLWVDELLTATLVSDPSITHMMSALRDQVDTSPPAYYLLAWLWVRIAGVSAMSLRVFSALLAAGAFWILWVALRPYASVAVRAAALGAGLLLPSVMQLQIAEARSYGLLILAAAITLAAVDRVSATQLFIGELLLLFTHNYGLLFGAAALAALVIASFRNGSTPWRVYLAGLAPFALYPFWIPALRNQMDVGNPRFPIPVPDARDLIHGLALGTSGRAVAFIAFFAAVAIIVARRSEPTEELPGPRETPRAMLLTCTLWVGVGVAAWIASRVWRPIYLPRYLVPLGCAYAAAGAVVLQRAIDLVRARARARGPGLTSAPPSRSYVVAVVAIGILGFAAPIRRAQLMPRGVPPAGDSLDVKQDLPIAAISTHSYLPRVFYSARPERYVFILDWENALRDDAPVGPTEYKLMAAMGRNYPSHRVQQSADFLREHSRFLVIDEAGLWWFKSRILGSPLYATTKLADRQVCGSGQPEDRCAVYLVERRAPADTTHPR